MFVFKHFISVDIKKNIFTYKIIMKVDTSYLDTESLQKLNTKTLSRILIYVRTKYP